MKISVIMASFLGDYPANKAPNKDKKMIRAVNSFLKQTYEDKELIIISDGCEITKKLYNENWASNPQIKYFHSIKLPIYSGSIRSMGQRIATGDIITYLDNDDIIGKNHLEIIHNQFNINEYDWVYYDDYMALDKEFSKFYTRWVDTRYGSIGTSAISHINFHKSEKYKGINNIPDWKECNGYGHDWMFVLKLASFNTKFKKLEKMPCYIVCHHRDGSW